MDRPDAREVFVAGAAWWAGKNTAAVCRSVSAEAERYFPEGRLDHPAGFHGRHPPQGSWPSGYVGRAFVEGAKWQEYEASGGTMWQSDQAVAEREAERRYPREAACVAHG
jgi:hypothetical protein